MAVSTLVLYAALTCGDRSLDVACHMRSVICASQRVEHSSLSSVSCNAEMFRQARKTRLKRDWRYDLYGFVAYIFSNKKSTLINSALGFGVADIEWGCLAVLVKSLYAYWFVLRWRSVDQFFPFCLQRNNVAAAGVNNEYAGVVAFCINCK